VSDLIKRIGVVAAQEYEAARSDAKPRLDAWIDKTFALDDEEFLAETAASIHGAAIMQRFKGNHKDVHCQASACYFESRRRWLAAGHADDCRGSDIYSRAFRQVWIGQGHSADSYPLRPCTCGVAA
jgi:hypothetical protein